jgi:thioredoxin 1
MASRDVVTLTDATFHAEVLEAQTPVLVDFWAPWCGPCRALGPTIDDLAREYGGRVKVGKLNVDDNPATAREYQVRSIPTLIVFKDGKIVQGLVGGAPKARLSALLDGVLRSEGSALKAG